MSIVRCGIFLVGALFVASLGCGSPISFHGPGDGAAGATTLVGTGGRGGASSYGTGGTTAMATGGSSASSGSSVGGSIPGTGGATMGTGGGRGTGGRTGSGGTSNDGGAIGAGGVVGAGGANGGAGGTSALDAGQDAPIVCGNAVCTLGEYCCNAACSLCAPLGYGCIQGCGVDAFSKLDGDSDARDVSSFDASAERWTPAVDGALAAFCSGDAPKAVVNGVASTPTVSGGIMAYDCCDGGEFIVVTPSFDYKIYVMWESQVGGPVGYPATVDLANPGKGWGVRVQLSCAGGMSCYPSPDSYMSGFEGILEVVRVPSRGFDMSICLHLEEPTASPHSLLHSLDFYAAHITTY